MYLTQTLQLCVCQAGQLHRPWACHAGLQDVSWACNFVTLQWRKCTSCLRINLTDLQVAARSSWYK